MLHAQPGGPSDWGLRCAAVGAVPEVDSVLTTGEVAQMLSDSGAALPSLPEATLQPLLGAASDGRLYGYPGGAGGYLDHIFRCPALPTAVTSTSSVS